jgi:hypothetical protein
VLRSLRNLPQDVADLTAAMRAELDRRGATGSTGARVLQCSVYESQLLRFKSDTRGRKWWTTRPLG